MMIIHSPQPWVEVNQSEDHYVEGNRAACRLCFVQRRAGCDLVSYLTPRLFSHIGIKRPTWETDPLGNSFGAGGLFPIRIRLSLLLPNAVKVKNLCVHYMILCVQNYKLTFIGKQHPRHFYKGKEQYVGSCNLRKWSTCYQSFIRKFYKDDVENDLIESSRFDRNGVFYYTN